MNFSVQNNSFRAPTIGLPPLGDAAADPDSPETIFCGPQRAKLFHSIVGVMTPRTVNLERDETTSFLWARPQPD